MKNKAIKKMHANYISPSHEGDHFQMYFDNDKPYEEDETCAAEESHNEDKSYFLIQWGIEYEDEEDIPCYIETDDLSYAGHVWVKKAVMGSTRFYIQCLESIHKKDLWEIEVTFPVQKEKTFLEAKKVLKCIIPHIVFEK